MTIQTQFDLSAFKDAVADSTHGSDAQLDFFCDDIEWVEIDHRTPPSSPALLRGRDAVADVLRGVTERGIKTTVVDGLIAGDRGAIAIRCEYPQGGLVRENALIEIRGGRIARWEGVQAWDQ
jgi:SnoaL-like domain